MSVEKVREYLAPYGRAGEVLEFDSSSATVELAAQALGVEGARIAKTLSFAAPEGCILLVAAGDARVDNGAFKRFFGFKARMLPAEEVEEKTGYAVGGVCPFANPEGTAVYLDESLRRFETVFPACGSSNSAIRLSCEDLYELSHARQWVDLCKGWRPE